MTPRPEMTTEQLDALIVVLNEVWDERKAQHAKFGEQNIADGTGPSCLRDLADTGTSAGAARGNCKRMAKEGRDSFANILWEELAEAFEETDPARLREELVQCAAVVVQWVEKLDREVARAQPQPCEACQGGGVTTAVVPGALASVKCPACGGTGKQRRGLRAVRNG